MERNTGIMPGRCYRRRVHVILRSGYDTRKHEPAGWPADGQYGCNWALRGTRADIIEWEFAYER